MIDCKTVQDNLSAYLDDELSADEGRKIHHHLQTCQVCNKEYMELKITSAIMRSLNDLEPPPGLQERVKERLLGETVNGPVSRLKRVKWYSFGAVAAGLLLLVGSWGLFFDGGLGKILGDSAKTQEIAFETPSSQAGDAGQEDVVVQPFSLSGREKAQEPSEAAPLTVPEEPEPMDVEGESGVDRVGPEQEHRADTTVPGTEPDDDMAAEAGRLGGQGPPSAASEEIGNHSAMDSEEASETSIAAIEPEAKRPDESDEAVDDPLSRATLMSSVPSEEGLQLELRLKTQDLSQTHKTIERIAQVYELQVLARETDEMISLEVFVPISQQGTVKEELEGLGHVTSEEVSDTDLNMKISTLIAGRQELEQQQIELRALINSGGSPENVQAWQKELAKVTEEADQIASEIQQLEAEHGLTCIKLILAK